MTNQQFEELKKEIKNVRDELKFEIIRIFVSLAIMIIILGLFIIGE